MNKAIANQKALLKFISLVNVAPDAQPILEGTHLTRGNVSEDFYLLVEFKVIMRFSFFFLLFSLLFSISFDRGLKIESLWWNIRKHKMLFKD